MTWPAARALSPAAGFHRRRARRVARHGRLDFIRAVQTGNNLYLCLDGKQMNNVAVPDGHLKTVESLFLGRDKFGIPAGESFFDGFLSDARMLKGALPCE